MDRFDRLCCRLTGLGGPPDPPCDQYYSAHQIYTRLSQKADKSATTRANAAAAAAQNLEWYNTCLTNQKVKEVVTDVPPPLVSDKLSDIIPVVPGSIPNIVTTTPTGAPKVNWMVFAGIAAAAGLGGYLIWRMRKK